MQAVLLLVSLCHLAAPLVGLLQTLIFRVSCTRLVNLCAAPYGDMLQSEHVC